MSFNDATTKLGLSPPPSG